MMITMNREKNQSIFRSTDPATLALKPPTVRQVSFDMEIQTIPSDPTFLAWTIRDGDYEGVASRTNDPPYECMSFWLSGSAASLFAPMHGETSQSAVVNMLFLLDKALFDRSFHGDFGLLLPGGPSTLRLLSNVELTKIATRAKYIREALFVAKATIDAGGRFSFLECCNQAAAYVSETSPNTKSASGVSVARWFRDFRATRTFAVSREKRDMITIRQAIQDFFRANECMYNIFLHYMDRYLKAGVPHNLVCATAYRYFWETLLPMGASNEGYVAETFNIFLHENNLWSLTPATFEAWFRDLLPSPSDASHDFSFTI